MTGKWKVTAVTAWRRRNLVPIGTITQNSRHLNIPSVVNSRVFYCIKLYQASFHLRISLSSENKTPLHITALSISSWCECNPKRNQYTFAHPRILAPLPVVYSFYFLPVFSPLPTFRTG